MSRTGKRAKDEFMEESLLMPMDEQKYCIPKNWIWGRLGEFVEFYSGSAFPIKYQGFEEKEISFYKVGNLKDVDNEYYLLKSKDTIDEDDRVKLKAKLVPCGTILFAKIGEAIKLNRRALLSKDSCIDNNVMGIRNKEGVLDQKYLFFWSLFQDFYQYSQATTVPSIRKSTLENVPFALPPLPEQKRIAKKVERLLRKIEDTKQLIQEANDTFQHRHAAILDKAFQGELTSNWREENGLQYDSRNIKLGELIKEGPQNGLYKPKSAYGAGVLIVRIDNFYNGKINEWETLKRLTLNQDEINLYGLCNNDLIINRVNSIEYLGKSALVRNLQEPCVFESNVMRFKVNELVDPEYLVLYLNSKKGLQELRKNAKHAVNQASINQQDVKNAIVPLPRIDEQLEIVEILKRLLKLEQETTKFIDLNNKLSMLKMSILSRAFRGELGTNEPTEENAIQLLKEMQIKS